MDSCDIWLPANSLGYAHLNDGVIGLLGYVHRLRRSTADTITVSSPRTWRFRSSGRNTQQWGCASLSSAEAREIDFLVLMKSCCLDILLLHCVCICCVSRVLHPLPVKLWQHYAFMHMCSLIRSTPGGFAADRDPGSSALAGAGSRTFRPVSQGFVTLICSRKLRPLSLSSVRCTGRDEHQGQCRRLFSRLMSSND